jgi:hypothetical protein
VSVDVITAGVLLDEIGANTGIRCSPELVAAFAVCPQLPGIRVNNVHEVIDDDFKAGSRSTFGFLDHPECRLPAEYVKSETLVRNNQSQNPSIIQDAVNILQLAHKIRHMLYHMASDHVVELSTFACFGEGDL